MEDRERAGGSDFVEKHRKLRERTDAGNLYGVVDHLMVGNRPFDAESEDA